MKTPMNSKQQLVKSTLSTLQNVAPPLAAIAARLSVITPEWALAIGLGSGLLAYWRDIAVERGKELLTYIEEHKTEFIETVVQAPEFKATLLNVWEMHIRENSENKRVRLRRFLLALGKGEKISTDLHTKFYSIINQMTDDEATAFGYVYRKTDKERHAHMNYNIFDMPELQQFEDSQRLDMFNSLHAYRLVNIREAQIGPAVSVQQITPFGDLFYEHVLKEDGI